MSIFRYPVDVALSPGGAYITIEAVVDTGASYTWIPASLLARLGATPTFRHPFVLADGRQIERDMTTVYVRVDGRERYTPCIFGDDDTNPLLGAVTLEELGLGVDPISRKLIAVPGILAAVAPRHRLVPAGEPDADPACRLTPEEGRRRQADTDKLFAQLAGQGLTDQGQEFRFRGEAGRLWQEVSTFVDEESRCCPFFTFEQIEQPDGVLLRVTGKAIGKE